MPKNRIPKPEPATTQPPLAEPTSAPIAGFKPTKVGDPQKFFAGYHMQGTVALTEPNEGFEAMFHGEDTPLEMNDGSEIRTWKFERNGTFVRLQGSTILDRELEALQKNFSLPIQLAVMYLGKGETKDKRPLNLFQVGVHPDSLPQRKETPDIFPAKK